MESLESLPKRPLTEDEFNILKKQNTQYTTPIAAFQKENSWGVICFYIVTENIGSYNIYNPNESEWVTYEKRDIDDLQKANQLGTEIHTILGTWYDIDSSDELFVFSGSEITYLLQALNNTNMTLTDIEVLNSIHGCDAIPVLVSDDDEQKRVYALIAHFNETTDISRLYILVKETSEIDSWRILDKTTTNISNEKPFKNFEYTPTELYQWVNERHSTKPIKQVSIPSPDNDLTMSIFE